MLIIKEANGNNQSTVDVAEFHDFNAQFFSPPSKDTFMSPLCRVMSDSLNGMVNI